MYRMASHSEHASKVLRSIRPKRARGPSDASADPTRSAKDAGGAPPRRTPNDESSDGRRLSGSPCRSSDTGRAGDPRPAASPGRREAARKARPVSAGSRLRCSQARARNEWKKPSYRSTSRSASQRRDSRIASSRCRCSKSGSSQSRSTIATHGATSRAVGTGAFDAVYREGIVSTNPYRPRMRSIPLLHVGPG